KTTAISNFVRSCCTEILRSTVRKASNSFSASPKRSPFLIPAHPRFATVVTEWSLNRRPNRAGTHSSSKTFTLRERKRFPSLLQETKSPARGKRLESLRETRQSSHRLPGNQLDSESARAFRWSTARRS